MVRFNQRKNSQRGAALVEAALTIVLIGVTAIQAIGVLGQGAADRMCDNAAKVKYSDDDVQVNILDSKYFYEKDQQKCCTQSPKKGRFANTGSVCL